MFVEISRWKILDIKQDEHKVLVKDHLFNKVRTYMIPNIKTANLDKDHLNVNTKAGKLMRIKLPSGSRRFIID